MHRSQIVAALASGTILAGCASGPVLEQRIGQALPDDVTASYDSSADTVIVTRNGATTALANSGASYGSTTSYNNLANGSFALRQTTASGKGEVMTITSSDAGLGIVGVIATRAEAVEVPSSGTADYSGEYTGLVATVADKEAVSVVTGTTCLTAVFGAGSIGGAIVGRTGTLADITIPSMPILSGGTFSGTVSGGEDVAIGDFTSNGQISGMFADVAAGEIVGGLRLDHTISGVGYYEVGGFTTGPGVCP